MKIRLGLGAFAATVLSACAPQGEAPGSTAQAGFAPPLPREQCFFTEDIRAHTIQGDRTLYLRLRDDRVYRVDMGAGCLAASLPLDAIVIRSHGTTSVCRPIDLDVSVLHGTRCIPQSIRMLSPAEVSAIPDDYRP